MNWRRMRRSAVVIAWLTMGSFAELARGDLAPTAPPSAIDLQAREVIEKFGKFIAGLDGFGIEVHTQIKAVPKGRPFATVQQVFVRRPAQLIYTASPAYGPTLVRCDGKSVAFQFLDPKKYVMWPAPKTCEGFIEPLLELKLTHPAIGSVVIAAILADDPAKQLLSQAKSIRYQGTEMLGSVECHLLQASDPELDWQVWIETGEKPVVRQWVPDLIKLYGPDPTGAGRDPTCVARLRWKFKPKWKENAFEIRIPADVVEAKTFEEAVGAHELRSFRAAEADQPPP